MISRKRQIDKKKERKETGKQNQCTFLDKMKDSWTHVSTSQVVLPTEFNVKSLSSVITKTVTSRLSTDMNRAFERNFKGFESQIATDH